MNKIQHLATFAIAALVGLTACSEKAAEPNAAQMAPTTSAALDQTYAQASERLFLSRPMSATLFGLPEKDAGQYYANKLDRFDPASEAKLRADLRALQQNIAAAKPADSVRARENQQVMASIVRYFAGNAEFPIGYIDTWMGLSPFVINQINGPLVDIPGFMKADQPLRNERDARDYIARLHEFTAMVDSVLAKLDADVASGWIAPKVTLRGAVNYLQNFRSAKPAEHALVTNLRDKLSKLADLDPALQTSLVVEAAAAVTDKVYPAYAKAEQRIAALIPQARDESGIWAQPQGAAYYQDAIHMLGDSDLSADDIHQLGRDEVVRITKEMDSILRQQGFSEGSVGARMNALGELPANLYADSEAGRAQLLADINGYIAEVTEAMAPLFKSVPPYAVEVRAFAKEVQDGAPGGQYTSPSLDGSKPGIYWINLRDMKANPRFSLKTLTYHEANPGHHWQIALNLAQTDLPFLRRIAPYNAYTEGWALYSERVAQEMGMYKSDPLSDLGRLQAEMFRAVRLVVDTGLHHKRWTREQAITYMADTTGTAQSDVVAEIERYMAWPGQALGYKLGQLKILSLRDYARTTLGDKFDLAEFHDLVLLGGAVPMMVLDAKVKAWVKTKQAG